MNNRCKESLRPYANLTQLDSQILPILINLSPEKWHENIKIRIHSLKNGPNTIFRDSEIARIDFTYLKTWKKSKSPHYVSHSVDICATHILREINCYHFETPKIVIFTILAALNFDFLEIFDFFKGEIPPNINIHYSRPPKL